MLFKNEKNKLEKKMQTNTCMYTYKWKNKLYE